MHRILLIWGQDPAIRDSEETDKCLTEVKGRIEFRDLTFTFPHAAEPALKKVSFGVEAGQTLGIVGSVGSGKSTIVGILARLYDPPPGSVFLDGRDIREYPLDVLRRSVGVVFQETYLFSDTITENICFGMKRGPSEELAQESARIAGVEEDILAFPEGFNTYLGERGVNLSGGQKQRVSLARAVAADPAILMLDDAFASVDTNTEECILKSLRDVMRSRTTLLVSHRISTVQLADQVIVLDDGQIVEHGSHAELVARDGLYAEIYRRQLLEEAIAKAEE
ncbi:ATP-binding cassette domain-containing protein [bacterium]|nr:ATP-binding cassette domain-containing protein [bacterium]